MFKLSKMGCLLYILYMLAVNANSISLEKLFVSLLMAHLHIVVGRLYLCGVEN